LENLSITLPVQAWNIVLNALGQRPYAEVMELVAEIKKQADEQVNARSSAPNEASE